MHVSISRGTLKPPEGQSNFAKIRTRDATAFNVPQQNADTFREMDYAIVSQ